MARLGADLSGSESQDFQPLPPGDYVVKIIDSEVGGSKTGEYSQMVKWTLEVQGPTHAGRKLFDRMIIARASGFAPPTDPSKDPVRIGRAQLKTLAEKAGHPNPDFIGDTEELHGRVVTARVALSKDGEYNEIKGYKDPPEGAGGRPPMPGGGQAPKAPAGKPAPQAPAGGDKKTTPWG